MTKKLDTKKICLALQGGGAYGAYTWGILDRLLEDGRLDIDAISATSAGSVNAVVLAYGMLKNGREGAREELKNFWQSLSQYGAYFSPIRKTFPEQLSSFDIVEQTTFTLFDSLTRLFSPYQFNPLDFNVMRQLLLEFVDFEALHKTNKIKLFFCATNIKSGKIKIFENKDINVDVVLASSCLPFLNQAVEIDDQFYWDGGFIGNPAIFPLIYNAAIDDILIIYNNPIIRNEVPISAEGIANRINEISFNSSLIRELRAIAFITSIIDSNWIKDEYKDKIKRKFIHIVHSDDVMIQYNLLNKFKWNWEFLCNLRDLGRMTMDRWLKENYTSIGKQSTINFDEFVGTK